MTKTALAGILVLCIGFGATSLQAQTPPATNTAPEAVLSQTIRGVTVTLSNIGWNPIDPSDNQSVSRRVFHVSYDVQANPKPRLAPSKSPLNYVTTAALTAPSGSAIGYGSGYMSELNGRKISAWITSPLIDTCWPLVGVNIDVLDPVASIRASGRSIEPITIFDIPTPTEADQITSVHAETTTPLGTRIIVEKVLISPAEGNVNTTFVFRIIPDVSAPDLSFNLNSDSRAVDDTGKNLGVGNMGGKGDALGQKTDPLLYSTSVTGIPSSSAQTMQLTLTATETSEHLKDERYYRHFHLLVPLTQPQDTAATSAP